MPTLSGAVDDLLLKPKTATNRLDELTAHLASEFVRHGLPGILGGGGNEVRLPGLARQEDWDLAFMLANKPRLIVSCKSILANLSGSVPNRLDDLMGEAANVQQLQPEIVIGYAVIVDVDGYSTRRGSNETWVQYFKSCLDRVSIRRSPLWNQGLIEAVWTIEIDKRLPPGGRIINPARAAAEGDVFCKTLISELSVREPFFRGS